MRVDVQSVEARGRDARRETHLVTDKVAHEIVDTGVDEDSNSILDDGDQEVGRSVHHIGLETANGGSTSSQLAVQPRVIAGEQTYRKDLLMSMLQLLNSMLEGAPNSVPTQKPISSSARS